MNRSRQHSRRHLGSEPTEEAGQDSEIDENAENIQLEMRDFDDVEGIEADVD